MYGTNGNSYNYWREEGKPPDKPTRLTIAQYVEGEDIAEFLQAFEQAMRLHKVPEEAWPEHLLRVVTGKARAAFAGVEPQAEYAVIKEAILERFEVSPEASRIKLREAKFDVQEDPGDLVGRLRTLAKRWLVPHSGLTEDESSEQAGWKETVIDRVVREQVLSMVLRHAREWLLQHNRESAAELTQRLREYRLLQKEYQGAAARKPKEENTPRRAGHSKPTSPCGGTGSSSLHVGSSLSQKDRNQERTCYKCGKKGHLMKHCRQEAFTCGHTI